MKNDALKTEVAELLTTSGAHADFDRALQGFPFADAGKRPKGIPWSAWQLLEHMRIAQADILEYVSTPQYREKKWPEEYWPKELAPASGDEWRKSVRGFRRDRKKLAAMLEAGDPLQPIAFANGKTLLKQALLAADHNAYHVGEFVRCEKSWETGHDRRR